jgi:hypothetical protein
MKMNIKSIFLCCLLAGSATAEIVTMNFSAEITNIDYHRGMSDSGILIAAVLTGSYTYDTETPDSNPLSTVGDYWHYAPPYGISISVGDYNFRTDPCNLNFLIEICNNHSVGHDAFVMRSYAGMIVQHDFYMNSRGGFDWQLDDDSGTAVDNTDLTRTPIDPNDWPDTWHHLTLNCSNFNLRAHVTEVNLAPLKLVYPNGGEEIQADRRLPVETISWISDPCEGSDIDNVKIELSLDGGSNWQEITTVPNTGNASWFLPDECSSQCLVRISDPDSDVRDQSDAPFSLYYEGMFKGDVNGDCYIDFRDFALIAGVWLECYKWDDPSCIDN